MIKKTFFAAIVLFLSACEQQPVVSKLPDDAVILAFGDSLTYGTGASSEQDYPSILSELTSLQVINAGIPGEITRNGIRRLPNLLDQHEPDLLVLIHGGNDILRKIPATQTTNHLQQMIQEADVREISVVMLGVPNLSLFLMSSADIYQNLASENQIPIDLDALPEILSDKSLKSDAIHPNNAGYRLMAESIHQLMQDSGAL